MLARVRTVLDQLEKRSQSEQAELEALNARGAGQVREAAHKLMLDVGPETGMMLNLFVLMAKARTVLEVGSSVGYSTIWMAEAARQTGGKVITLEMDEGKFKEMKANVEEAGLSAQVEPMLGDAAVNIARLKGPFDLVLLDHWKKDYVRAFDQIWPNVPVGGVVLADNILLPQAVRADAQVYVDHVRRAPGARSLTLTVGMGVELTTRISA